MSILISTIMTIFQWACFGSMKQGLKVKVYIFTLVTVCPFLQWVLELEKKKPAGQ